MTGRLRKYEAAHPLPAGGSWSAYSGELIDELGALLKLPAFRWVGAEQIQHGDLNAFPEARRVPKV